MTMDNGTKDVVPRVDASTNAITTITYEHHEIHGGSHYYIDNSVTLNDTNTHYLKIVTPNNTKESHITWDISGNGIFTARLYEIPTGGMTGGTRMTIHANNRNKDCYSGRHTAAGNNATVMTDSGAAFVPGALVGMQIFNNTDKSSAFITANTATTVTVAALAGGTDNDWDTNDVYEINNSRMIITSGVTVATSLGLPISYTSVGGTAFKGSVGGQAARHDEIPLRKNTTYFKSIVSGSDANIISYKAVWYEHTPKG